MNVVFIGFLTKLTNMTIKMQYIIYINTQKLNVGFTSYFNTALRKIP